MFLHESRKWFNKWTALKFWNFATVCYSREKSIIHMVLVLIYSLSLNLLWPSSCCMEQNKRWFISFTHSYLSWHAHYQRLWDPVRCYATWNLSLYLLQEIRNRHWLQVMSVTNSKFQLEANLFKLGHLLDIGLLKWECFAYCSFFTSVIILLFWTLRRLFMKYTSSSAFGTSCARASDKGQGDCPPRILKFSAKKSCFFNFED